MTQDPLGDLLVQRKLLTAEQLRTAMGLQRELGGDLRSLVVKLGYVKESEVASALAQQEHLGAASDEITADVIDFAFVEKLPRELLERHQVVPLKSDGHELVLAMTDPNDLAAIEEIQFRAGVQVEPAVATRDAIRKVLAQLDDLLDARAEEQDDDDDDDSGELPIIELEAEKPAPKGKLTPPVKPGSQATKRPAVAAAGNAREALKRLPIEKLLRAYIQLQVEKGNLEAEELLARARDM